MIKMAKLRIKRHPIYNWLYGFSDGRVYSTKSHKFRGHLCKSTGYVMVGVGGNVRVGVHRIIAECFIQKPESKEELVPNHKNQIRNDNRVENLEWLTQTQNCQYEPTRLANREAKRHKMKQVQCLETGRIFECINDVVREMGIKQTSISRHLNHPNKLKSIKGYHFKFI